MPSNRQHFDTDLKELQNLIVLMGDKVTEAINRAAQSLKDGNEVLAQSVIQQDEAINHIEAKIDAVGTNLIATQQPVASDLRRILASFKIANDLERMGDLAVDVAKVTLRNVNQTLVKPLVDLPRMAEIVQDMTRDSITCFLEENVDLAYRMAKMDDEVDHLHAKILKELFVNMSQNTNQVNQVLNLCFASRYFERMADHATNIGESVVYLVKGKRPDLN